MTGSVHTCAAVVVLLVVALAVVVGVARGSASELFSPQSSGVSCLMALTTGNLIQCLDDTRATGGDGGVCTKNEDGSTSCRYPCGIDNPFATPAQIQDRCTAVWNAQTLAAGQVQTAQTAQQVAKRAEVIAGQSIVHSDPVGSGLVSPESHVRKTERNRKHRRRPGSHRQTT